MTSGWQGATGGTGTTAEMERAHADLDGLGVPRVAGQLVLTLSARIGWLVAHRPQTQRPSELSDWLERSPGGADDGE